LAKGVTIHKIVHSNAKAITHPDQAARKKLKAQLRKEKAKEAKTKRREKKALRAAAKKAAA
jgi:hypothetical protein